MPKPSWMERIGSSAYKMIGDTIKHPITQGVAEAANYLVNPLARVGIQPEFDLNFANQSVSGGLAWKKKVFPGYNFVARAEIALEPSGRSPLEMLVGHGVASAVGALPRGAVQDFAHVVTGNFSPVGADADGKFDIGKIPLQGQAISKGPGFKLGRITNRTARQLEGEKRQATKAIRKGKPPTLPGGRYGTRHGLPSTITSRGKPIGQSEVLPTRKAAIAKGSARPQRRSAAGKRSAQQTAVARAGGYRTTRGSLG